MQLALRPGLDHFPSRANSEGVLDIDAVSEEAEEGAIKRQLDLQRLLLPCEKGGSDTVTSLLMTTRDEGTRWPASLMPLLEKRNLALNSLSHF